MFDILITGAKVVDGSGGPAFLADIAISGGRIAKIGPGPLGEAQKVIDATGLVAAPGFIDTHTHSDAPLLTGTDAYNYLEQGTTTEIAGQCGGMAAPVYAGLASADRLSEQQRAVCVSHSSYLAYIDSIPLGTNVAFFAGHGNIRGMVMGYSDARPTEEQVAQMRAIMQEAMDAGCLGFSTGLVYVPSVYATTEEIIEIAKVAHENGGMYTSHIRGEGGQLIASIEEALDVGRATGIPVNISHIKVGGKPYEGMSKELVRIIDAANASGLRVTADQYPFLGGSAPFLSQIPPRFQTEGREATLNKLADPAMRKEIERAIFNEVDIFESNIYCSGYGGILMATCAQTPEYVGKTIAQIATEEGKAPFDVCCDILIKNGGTVQGIYLNQNESDLLRLLAHPLVMPGSDWSDYTEHYPTDKVAGGHPRAIGTMTRRLALIREHGLETLEQAIYRMTALPASVYGLGDIGLLKEGMRADITIFDYNTVDCTADYVHPFRKNTGIHHVLVGGRHAVRDGSFTGEMGGVLIRRHR